MERPSDEKNYFFFKKLRTVYFFLSRWYTVETRRVGSSLTTISCGSILHK